MNDFRPQGEEILSFFRHLEQDTVPHAVLISGFEGVGKRTLALLISQYLLCESGNPPCGRCPSCLLALKYEHPDQILIQKGIPLSSDVKEGRSSIPIEDIREMIRFTGTAAIKGGKRIVLIHDADTMTPQAQNALLKTLEEPPADTFFFLVTSHPESLLNTVVSRCSRLHLHSWTYDYILNVLKNRNVPKEKAEASAELSDGSVGRAIQISEDEDYWTLRKEVMQAFFFNTRRSDILTISGRWKTRKNEADKILSILESIVGQMIMLRFNGHSSNIENVLPLHWIHFINGASPEAFCAIFDQIAEARKALRFSVNFQAVFEQLLLFFVGEGIKWLQ